MKFHKVAATCLVFCLCAISGGDSLIEHMTLPGGLEDCFARHAAKTSIVDTVGESIASFCFGQYMWQAAKDSGIRGFNISREAYAWAHNLLKRSDLRRHKRQVPVFRIRKEYRRLTELERANFHRAVNMLKMDRSVRPNMYDALSAVHQGVMTTSAHGGPNFLGFHRIYLLMFENALRQKIPSVTVPYWDSTLDQALMNPTQSVIFTDQFLGNGFGVVRTGPFARWGTLSGPLIRNTGQSGQLFNPVDIARIVLSARLAQITEPNAPVNSSLEFLHNQVHLWIDGQMGSLETASHDPIFWMHHSYVDYVWEMFRNNQRRFGIDPTTDYPIFVNNTMHMPMQPMGLANFRNIDGMSDVYTAGLYRYEPTPRCSIRFPNCGSPYMRCVMRGFRPACVSVDRTGVPRISMPRRNLGAFRSVARSTGASQFQRAMMLNSAFTTQSQMRMRMSQRRLLQRQMIMQQQPRRLAAPMMEAEGLGMDDAAEGRHSLKKRAALFISAKYITENPTLQMKSIPKQTLASMSSMGNDFDKTEVNIHSNTQRPMSMSLEPPQQLSQSDANMSSGIPPIPQQSQEVICPAIPTSEGYQNTFNVNGRSDIHQWVYVPVKIIYQRPPTFASYSSFPIVNGEPEEEDIYSTNPNMRNVLQMGKPAAYPQCRESGAGKVYISSQGLNYMGTYKEYAVVDHRLVISIATAYVAVKSPELGASEVFLNAYDSCGRVCQPYCKLSGSGGFQRCSGAFRITSQAPKLYGANYGDAVTNLWHFSANGNCPSMQDNKVYIQFHCNFRDAWPFAMSSSGSSVSPDPAGTPPTSADEYEEPETPMEREVTRPMSANIPPSACHIGNGCIVSSGCKMCTSGQTLPCIGACSVYASCQNGGLYVHNCPDSTWFNPNMGKCVHGLCYNNNQKQWWHTGIGWK